MTAIWPEGASLPVLATGECPYCGVVVPSARYCGACGSELFDDHGRGHQRLHAYAAFPDEPVLRMSVVTSLFPHLAHHSRTPFRVAFGAIVALVIAFSLAGATAPLTAVCSLGVTLLFLLYVVEVDPYEATFVAPTIGALVVGAGLGVGWALIGGHQVDRALVPSPTASLLSGTSLIAALAVPVVGQALMCVPVVALRLLQRGPYESLDGFVAGATGAVGFTAAATVVLLAPWFSQGQSLSQSFLDNLAAGLVRGVTFPLVSALVTGYVGATLWSSSRRSPSPGRWLTSPVVALLVAVAVQVGSAFANLAALPDTTVLLAQLGALAAGVVLVRIGLHHTLVHEAQGETVGPPRVCAHCNHLVPAAAFCPQCGVTERAIARWRRWHHGHPFAPAASVPGDGGDDGGHGGAPASAEGEQWWTRPWPTAPPGPLGVPVSFPLSPVRAPHGDRVSHRVLVALLLAGVAAVSVVFVIVALVATPGPPPPCPPLRCEAPPVGGEAATSSTSLAAPGGRSYSFAHGFSLRVYPLIGTSTLPQVTVSGSAITLTYPFVNRLGGAATLTVVGGADRGATPQELVDDEVTQIAPNAHARYQLPRTYVGYWPAYGAAYTTQVTSSGGSAVTMELIVLAAVHDGQAVTVTAVGRLVGVGPRSLLYNGHPSPAGVSVAYVSGETVNSITFPGSPLP